MLKVQEYLRSGKTLEDLKKDYAIKVRVDLTLNCVCLNYNQIESPMGLDITEECRALILEIGTWDILSWPFRKFYNVGEFHAPTDFNWDNFQVFDKLDGSLIHIWHHERFGWQIATRGVPDARTNIDDTGITFRELVLQTLKEAKTSLDILCNRYFVPWFCYSFELTAPENQVVVQYDQRKLTLIGIRNLETLEESPVTDLLEAHPSFPLPVVKRYSNWSREFVAAQVNTLNPRESEGYVLVDSSWKRLKIKSESYCFMSNKRDALGKSSKARLEVILAGKEDDVLPILPKYIQDKIIGLKLMLSNLCIEIDGVYDLIKDIELQKVFAEFATKYKYSAILFAMRKTNKTATEVITELPAARILDYFSILEDNSDE